MKPTVGRIVHFGGSKILGRDMIPWAAIITFVWQDGTVDLAYWNGSGTPGKKTKAEYSETLKMSKWTWPPREVDNRVVLC